MIEFLSAPEKIETRFDLVCIASKSSFNWLLLNTFQLILDFPKNRIKSNDVFLIKVCIPPEEEAFASKACEIHYCL